MYSLYVYFNGETYEVVIRLISISDCMGSLVISYCLGKNTSIFIRDTGKKRKNHKCPAKIKTVDNPDRHNYWMYTLSYYISSVCIIYFSNLTSTDFKVKFRGFYSIIYGKKEF